MLIAEGMETVPGGDEKIVSGDMAAGAERWPVRRNIPGYLVPPLFLHIGDSAPCGKSPPVRIEGCRLPRSGGERKRRLRPPAAFAVAVVEGDAAGGAVAV